MHLGLVVLERLVRLDREELAHQEVLMVHHDLVVQQEVLRVLPCPGDQRVRLYLVVQQEGPSEDQ